MNVSSFLNEKAVHEFIIQAVWNYIRGMLQNLGQIKLARLETMLKTFSSFNPQLKIDSAALIELLRIGSYHQNGSFQESFLRQYRQL